MCNVCNEKDDGSELITEENSKPLELAGPNELNSNKGDYTVGNDNNTSKTIPEMRKKFWDIIKNQLDYGNNPRVKEIERQYGPFPFDDRLINDSIPKVVVGPLLLENGATYYGHWYLSIISIGTKKAKKSMDSEC